ncbi:MAG TPA: hypothetical protein VHZ98_11545 [Galbitalea sp.]|jgi:hypothetical protein|nr:hypothetical protein [Galbitalea sp.]
MTTPDDDGTPTRADLERIAYGRAETPTQIAAAQDALRRLVEDDAASTVIVAPPTIPDVVPDPVAPEELYADPAPLRRRRTLVPLLIVVGLFAGAVIGILVTRPEQTTPIGGAAVSGTPTPASTANAAAALKSLVAPQTKADKGFPLPAYSGTAPIQPASVHRILTSSDGATLWIGRSDTDICLMWSRHDPTDGNIEGGETCSTPTQFATQGLTLSEGSNGWTWNGIAFTTTLGY